MNKEVRDILDTYGDPTDPWGSTQEAWFSIADVLYVTRDEIPSHWKYNNPWPPYTVGRRMYEVDGLGIQLWEMLGEDFNSDDLRHAGNVLARYSAILKAQGRDY